MISRLGLFSGAMMIWFLMGTVVSGWINSNNAMLASTQLTAPISATSTDIPVVSTVGFAQPTALQPNQ